MLIGDILLALLALWFASGWWECIPMVKVERDAVRLTAKHAHHHSDFNISGERNGFALGLSTDFEDEMRTEMIVFYHNCNAVAKTVTISPPRACRHPRATTSDFETVTISPIAIPNVVVNGDLAVVTEWYSSFFQTAVNGVVCCGRRDAA